MYISTEQVHVHVCIVVCLCLVLIACSWSQQSLVAEHTKELVKLKEEVNSFTIKLKWAQNKLKAETEAHKV